MRYVLGVILETLKGLGAGILFEITLHPSTVLATP